MNFEVLIAVTNYEKVKVKAPSAMKATDKALTKFKGRGEVVSCNPVLEDENGNQVVGTSHLNNDDFGAFIRGE